MIAGFQRKSRSCPMREDLSRTVMSSEQEENTATKTGNKTGGYEMSKADVIEVEGTGP